jgi:hypothetical protein
MTSYFLVMTHGSKFISVLLYFNVYIFKKSLSEASSLGVCTKLVVTMINLYTCCVCSLQLVLTIWICSIEIMNYG